jgi:cell division protein FtsQ
MNVLEVSMSARGAWLIKLYNGIEVNFGKENLNERFDSFIDIAKDILSQDPGRIESVDMRYDDGFTLLLKKDN